jgi:hypothetical protein
MTDKNDVHLELKIKERKPILWRLLLLKYSCQWVKYFLYISETLLYDQLFLNSEFKVPSIFFLILWYTALLLITHANEGEKSILKYKMHVSFFSIAFLQKISFYDKYSVSYAWDTCRNTCRSSC